MENINEPITVEIVFREDQHPDLRGFVWDGRHYPVESLQLVTRMQRGQDKVFVFSVANRKGAYKLYFNTGNLRWTLAQAYFI